MKKNVNLALSTLEKLDFIQDSESNLPSNCQRLVRQVRKDFRLTRSRDGVAVELHWRLSRNPHLLPWQFRDAIKYADQLKTFAGEHYVLRSSALLVYLTCHGTLHSWFRLKWIADIERMALQMSAEELSQACELAERYGCMRIFATSMTLTRNSIQFHSISRS